MARSVVDIGMEILRAEGALAEPVVSTSQVSADSETDDADEADKVGELLDEVTTRLGQLADQLAVRQTLDLLATQVSRLTDLVVQLQLYVTQPRVKVPVRDEAGRIVEVREVVAGTGPTDAV